MTYLTVPSSDPERPLESLTGLSSQLRREYHQSKGNAVRHEHRSLRWSSYGA